ncbi:anthocyanidin 3-O-glucosyltransferase 2-like [Rhododendron vialii]|uniref:anthocyanidin 3-O-glucosyltransferase 2-like n=1 Tax=Rhododendron vialii TaxID=182163 RepID=UPI00265D8893|nr:anthocyanidin 3-O-glucosyltransferase 2-like [Rhododendron vialii]
MKTTATVELVFIPDPGMSHLVSTVEMAKQLVSRDHRLSITVLIMKRPFDKSKASSSTQSLLLTAAEDRLEFVYLPLDEAAAAELQSKSPENFMFEFIKMNKQNVRDHVRTMVSTGSTKIAGFVVDIFCTPMMDVAAEFGVPSYAFFTSNATVLGVMFHLETLSPEEYNDLTKLNDSDTELEVELPGFVNPVPVKVLPAPFVDKKFGSRFMSIAKRLRETKGIMVNTFEELESSAVRFLAENDKVPPVYPVGPLIHLVNNKNEEEEEAMEIMKWLDNQPPSSVVFLCFGTMGSFEGDQLKEIAQALERSGHRFLWSVRRTPQMGKIELPGEYEDLTQVLPEGFLERTMKIGKVIGWAPQVAILSHKAVGGFVSHCGWNSMLESLWCGVPMATWPMYAEQQMNAFKLVRELGLAVEIKLDYKKDFGSDTTKVTLVTAEEIDIGIRKLMEGGNACGEEIKRRVKEMSKMSKVVMVEGGSSYNSIGLLIEDFMNNIHTHSMSG